jgi:hypothetical protein
MLLNNLLTRIWSFGFRTLSGALVVLAGIGAIAFGLETVTILVRRFPSNTSPWMSAFAFLMALVLALVGWRGLKVRSPADIFGSPRRGDAPDKQE